MKYLTAASALFALGCVLAGYMVWNHYALVNGQAGFGSFCSISRALDCDVVNTSKYSEFLGVPLATWALGYCLFAALLCLTGARNPYSRREALLVMAPLSFAGAVVSVVTFCLSFFALGTLCVMCSGLQILNLAAFVLIVLAGREYGGPWKEWAAANRGRVWGWTAAGAVLLAVTHGLTAQLHDEIPLNPDLFLAEFRAQPVANVDPGSSPRAGHPGDAPPVRLIEFFDFQCPACAMAAKQMHRLLKIYGDRVQVVFKHFPLDPACNPHVKATMHESACVAARASFCAQKQGKFELLYEKMFTNQKAISRRAILEWAAELGIDAKALDECIPSEEASSAVLRDVDAANAAGLDSTPTFFVEGRKLPGVMTEEKLKLVLNELGK